MKKYLVILDLNTGYAELGNVAILFAKNKDDAASKLLKKMRLSNPTSLKVYAELLDDINEDWMHYNR